MPSAPINSFLHHRVALLFLAVAVAFFFYLIFPYAGAILIGIVFAILFYPLYLFLRHRLRISAAIAGFAVITIFISAVVVPAILVGYQLFQEAATVYARITNSDFSPSLAWLKALPDRFHIAPEALPLLQSNISLVRELSTRSVNFILSIFTNAISGAFQIGILVFIFFFVFYYTLKDGTRFYHFVLTRFPSHLQHSFAGVCRDLYLAIHSIVRGFLLVALAQGFLIGAGFSLTGIPQPIVWGTIGVFTSLIPTIGTALVTVPAVVYLLITQNFWGALIMLVWGIGVVGTADNVLRPLLTSRSTGIHPLFIFLAVFGGLETLGLSGFLLGPLLVAFIISLTKLLDASPDGEHDRSQ